MTYQQRRKYRRYFSVSVAQWAELFLYTLLCHQLRRKCRLYNSILICLREVLHDAMRHANKGVILLDCFDLQQHFYLCIVLLQVSQWRRVRNSEDFIPTAETRHCEATKIQKKHFSVVSRSNLMLVCWYALRKTKWHTNGANTGDTFRLAWPQWAELFLYKLLCHHVSTQVPSL